MPLKKPQWEEHDETAEIKSIRRAAMSGVEKDNDGHNEEQPANHNIGSSSKGSSTSTSLSHGATYPFPNTNTPVIRADEGARPAAQEKATPKMFECALEGGRSCLGAVAQRPSVEKF